MELKIGMPVVVWIDTTDPVTGLDLPETPILGSILDIDSKGDCYIYWADGVSDWFDPKWAMFYAKQAVLGEMLDGDYRKKV